MVSAFAFKATETRILQTNHLQPFGDIGKNNFWSSVVDLRCLWVRWQGKIRPPSQHIYTAHVTHLPWIHMSCMQLHNSSFSWSRLVFMSTVLPGYIFIPFAVSRYKLHIWKFGPIHCNSPIRISSLVRICSVIGIASIKKRVLPHFHNWAKRIPTTGKSPNTTRTSNKQNN